MKKITDLKSYLKSINDGDKVYRFITETDENTPKGRHDFNENLYVNVVALKTGESFDGVFESHRDYIDLHVLIDGEEKIYYGDKDGMAVIKVYDKDGDYELLKGESYSSVVYGKMQAIEFDAEEPHMAGGAASSPQMILKAIVKIKKP